LWTITSRESIQSSLRGHGLSDGHAVSESPIATNVYVGGGVAGFTGPFVGVGPIEGVSPGVGLGVAVDVGVSVGVGATVGVGVGMTSAMAKAAIRVLGAPAEVEFAHPPGTLAEIAPAASSSKSTAASSLRFVERVVRWPKNRAMTPQTPGSVLAGRRPAMELARDGRCAALTR